MLGALLRRVPPTRTSVAIYSYNVGESDAAACELAAVAGSATGVSLPQACSTRGAAISRTNTLTQPLRFVAVQLLLLIIVCLPEACSSAWARQTSVDSGTCGSATGSVRELSRL